MYVCMYVYIYIYIYIYVLSPTCGFPRSEGCSPTDQGLLVRLCALPEGSQEGQGIMADC